MSPTRYHYATLLILQFEPRTPIYINCKLIFTYFIMQVLLPDFAFQGDYEPGKFPKSHTKNLSFNRARTMETRRTQTLNSFRNREFQKSQQAKKNQSVSFYLPKTERKPPNEQLKSFQSSQLQSFSFFGNAQQHPIHSRRTTKFVKTLVPRKRSNSKPVSEPKKKVINPGFNFLKARKYSFKLEEPFDPEIAQIEVKNRKMAQPKRNFSSNFPSKKVKSAFIKQEYRPWSPKKYQLNFDQISS